MPSRVAGKYQPSRWRFLPAAAATFDNPVLVLSFAVRGFSPGTPVSPSLKKHFHISIRPGIRQTKNHFVDILPPNHYLVIYLFIYFNYIQQIPTRSQLLRSVPCIEHHRKMEQREDLLWQGTFYLITKGKNKRKKERKSNQGCQKVLKQTAELSK